LVDTNFCSWILNNYWIQEGFLNSCISRFFLTVLI
jgi:hypothetical protein